MMSPEHWGDRGFTLIEVLVALAIAALGLGALMAAAGQGLRNVAAADRYVEATRRAQSHLALATRDVGADAGDSSGDDGNGFSWRVQVRPVAAHAPSPGAQATPTMYSVDVTIGWRGGESIKNVSLRSQALGYPPGAGPPAAAPSPGK